MQNVILFDLGGVIINWNDDWLYDEITSQLKQPFEKIKSKYNANLCSLFESKINESEFWDLVLGSDNIIDDKIINTAQNENDHRTNFFLEWFVHEQIEEEDLFESILQKFDVIGRDKLAIHEIDKILEKLSHKSS